MSAIKALRASGTRVQADVVLGVADNGSVVTTNVVIDRFKNPELAEALAPLEALLKRVAEERTAQAKTNTIIEERVRARLAIQKRRAS